MVVSIGPKDVQQQLRATLAMGADRAILVGGDDAELDAELVARTVQKLVEREKPDLVLMGKLAVDGDANQVGQLLAGYLGWPQATFAGNDRSRRRRQGAAVGREVDAGVETRR